MIKKCNKIFLVTLPRAQKRRQRSIAQLEAEGVSFEIIDGIDGKTDRSLSENLVEGLTPSHVGCYMSHLKTFLKIVELDLPYGIILEDDFLLLRHGELADVAKELPANFDFAFLHQLRWDGDELKVVDRMGKFNRLLPCGIGGHASIVSQKFARYFLENHASPKAPLDITIREISKNPDFLFLQLDDPLVGISGEISLIESPSHSMKTLIIQQGRGDNYRKMLEATTEHHRAYADRHNMDLWTISGPVQLARPAIWDKTLLIQRALALDYYDLIVWLDADTLIANDRDLREATSEFWHIGMVRHAWGWEKRRELGWHYNAGAIYVIPSATTKAAFDKLWAHGEDGSDEDQNAVMDMWAETPGLFQTIDNRWNALARIPHDEDSTVLAWHGYDGDRVAVMKEKLSEIKG